MLFNKRSKQGETDGDDLAATPVSEQLDLRRLRRVDLIELLVSDMDTIEDLRTQLLSTELSLSEATDMAERLKAKLNEKDAQIDRLKMKLDDKDAQIGHLKSRLDLKDQIIDDLREGNPRSDAIIPARFEGQVVARDDAQGDGAQTEPTTVPRPRSGSVPKVEEQSKNYRQVGQTNQAMARQLAGAPWPRQGMPAHGDDGRGARPRVPTRTRQQPAGRVGGGRPNPDGTQATDASGTLGKNPRQVASKGRV